MRLVRRSRGEVEPRSRGEVEREPDRELDPLLPDNDADPPEKLPVGETAPARGPSMSPIPLVTVLR